MSTKLEKSSKDGKRASLKSQLSPDITFSHPNPLTRCQQRKQRGRFNSMVCMHVKRRKFSMQTIASYMQEIEKNTQLWTHSTFRAHKRKSL
jgi:hypothetical protein